MFIVQLFMGTSYSFKTSKTIVYICPLKTNDIKKKTTFSLKVTVKVTFPSKTKCYSMMIVLTWIMPLPPPFGYHYHLPLWTCLEKKKLFSPSIRAFQNYNPLHPLREKDTMIHLLSSRYSIECLNATFLGGRKKIPFLCRVLT